MSSDTSPPVTILLCQARSRARADTHTHHDSNSFFRKG